MGSPIQIKQILIQQIDELDDVEKIERIKQYVDFELSTEIYQLSTAQKKRMKEAQNDNCLSEAEANKRIDEWLQEK